MVAFLHLYFVLLFFQILGASLSPKLFTFHTLFHTELSDNSPQPSGTIMVLKSVEIDPVDPGMNFHPPSSTQGGRGGRCFPSPPFTYYLFPCLRDKTFSIKLVMGYFLFFTQHGELIINLKWNKNDHAGISMLQL